MKKVPVRLPPDPSRYPDAPGPHDLSHPAMGDDLVDEPSEEANMADLMWRAFSGDDPT
jgi:hypothetical protein